MNEQQVDVLIVGFGAAGASTAMEALECAEAMNKKLKILIVDRFEGGGATSRSGGIVYFGGGTDVQKKLGLNDDVENMFRYLKMETKGSVTDETLWRFCKTSPDCAAWLRDSFKMKINLPDESAVLCPFKTSNAPDRYSLFYSGSETAAPYNQESRAVPRGHKAMGPGNLVGTGNVLFAEMEREIMKCEKRGISVQRWTKVTDLIWENSKLVGAKVLCMSDAPIWARSLHYLFVRYGGLTNPFNELDTFVASSLNNLENTYGVRKTIYAPNIVLATGGFGRNAKLIEQYVPKYTGCMPIGSAGDDGYGIFELGVKQANAKTENINFASAWKFIVPAASMAKGVLVNSKGIRIINEDRYGAELAQANMIKNDGNGYLILDQKIASESLNETSGEMLLFQKAFTYINIYWNRVKANSLEELEKLLGTTNLIETINEYNSGCEEKKDCKFGKQPHLLSKICHPPFYAVKFAPLATKLWPTPFFTLGGLAVDQLTGNVLDKEDKPIPGLFAAGRAQPGIPGRSYVSGLSIADCIFSGRRAGHFIVTEKPYAQEIFPVPEFVPTTFAKL